MSQWGFGMPPPGFDALIAQKYAIQQQEANSRSNQENALANETNVRAGLLPAQTNAEIDLTKANTNQVKTNTQYIPGLARSEIFSRLSGGIKTLADADETGLQSAGLRRSFTTLDGQQYGTTGQFGAGALSGLNPYLKGFGLSL